jgi:hypothetical protein
LGFALPAKLPPTRGPFFEKLSQRGIFERLSVPICRESADSARLHDGCKRLIAALSSIRTEGAA